VHRKKNPVATGCADHTAPCFSLDFGNAINYIKVMERKQK
jgi:hypothetical protein